MNLSYSGKNYNYRISYQKTKSPCLFSITAVHGKTRRISFITTTNFILSLFEISSEDNRFWESDWIISEAERKSYIKKFERCVNDKNLLIHLEKFLDEDRLEGEWENFEK